MTDNELIAEFMEIPKLEDYKGIMWDFQRTGKQIYSIRSNELGYNRSWDWLMPVVEKISEIHDSKFKYDFNEIKQGNWPKDNEYMEVIAMPLATPIIEAHKAVVQFIKFYNSQK